MTASDYPLVSLLNIFCLSRGTFFKPKVTIFFMKLVVPKIPSNHKLFYSGDHVLRN